jgi:DNA-directed RNA polymerase II subunit RPB1
MSDTYYAADVEKVVRVQFALMSPEEIRRRSVVEVTMEKLYNGSGIPCAGGLFDRKMGVLENGVKCTTDGLDKQECPGYFGHLELAMPVFYVQFIAWVKGVLETICFRCGSLRLNRELRAKKIAAIAALPKNSQRYTKMVRLTKDDKSACAYCPTCNARQPDKYIYEKEDLQILAEWTKPSVEPGGKETKSKVLMTPEYVQMLFKRLSDADAMLIGFDPKFSRPEWMICSVLPVAPPSVRPSVKKEGQQPRSEDDLTHKYIDIVKCNKMLKQKLHQMARQQEDTKNGIVSANPDAPAINSRMVESWRYILQYHVATLIDNECGVNQAQQRSGRPLKAIRQRLKSKEGRIRGNLMGKRVDFSARTVITPDPLLKLDELGVPMDMCKNLTFPERVNPFNMDRLRRMVRNGTDTYPGARIIQKANGRRLSLKFFVGDNHRHLLEEKALELQIGDVVHRHLLGGDPVLFNRQPSLHKMSMMCHRVKPMDIGKTFRLSVDATSPYNADFDGDEMNMHVPQSMEAATELETLAAVHRQLIGPAQAHPCIAPVQDTMLGAHLLSKETKRAFGRRQFMNTMMWTSKTWRELGDRAPSSETVDGNDAYTCILPEGLNIEMGNLGVVRDGKMISGTIKKASFTAQSAGLVHVAFQDLGPTMARDLIDDVRGMVTTYMHHRGFSVGVSDLVVSDAVKHKVKDVVQKCKKDVADKMKGIHDGSFKNATRETASAYQEMVIKSATDAICDDAATEILKSDSCRFKDMVEAGSKGKKINISQMIGCLGQQSVEGERVTYSFEDRTLPHFCKYDDSLEARGFVENSYLNGLTPHEFFFHAMGGRVGLIDTAVKTAQTGYIQRKLVKSMEDLRCENDETVRGANGRITHLLFGEDGMDSAKLEKQQVEFAACEPTMVRDYLGASPSKSDVERFLAHVYAPSTPGDKDAQLLDAQGLRAHVCHPPDVYKGLPVVTYFREVVCKGVYTSGKDGYDCSVLYPAHLRRIVRNVCNATGKAAASSALPFGTTLDALDALVTKLAFAKDPADPSGHTSINPATHVFRCLLYGVLLRVDVRKQLAVGTRFVDVLAEVEHRFVHSKVHAGEMVGVIAAQSVGEPATQMTLNTFHFAGAASKSKVTQGVPRLKEILTLTKNPKMSALTMFLEPAFSDDASVKRVKATLEITTLRDITKGTSIYYDPCLDRFGTMLVEDEQMLKYLDALRQQFEEGDAHEAHPNHWVVRLELDRAAMHARDLQMEEVYQAMTSLHGEDIEIEYSDDNSEQLLVRVRVRNHSDNSDQMDDYYLLKMLESNLLDNVVLRGVPLLYNIVTDTKAVGTTFTKKDGVYKVEDVTRPVLVSQGTKAGTNLLEVLIHPTVDATRTISDHITEVHEVLGIEATRELILRQIEDVISGSGGDPPSRRHIMLLADIMTCQGHSLVSIDRNGIKRSDIGPLARCSFEETDKQLYQAAIFGEHDDVDGVSANIMLGQVPPCGTGMVQVVFDEVEFARIQHTFRGAKGETWQQHVYQWERDLQGMDAVQAALDELDDDAMFTDEEDEEAVAYDTQMDFDYTDDMLEME